MPSKKRTEIPAEVAAQILFDSDRTCCVCRKGGKPVQIHHMDDDPSNSLPANLAVLCFDCHRDTQIRGGFDRKLDAAQIRRYKDDWISRVAARRDREHGPLQIVMLDVGGEMLKLKYVQVKESSDEYSYSFEASYPQIANEHSTASREANRCIEAFVTRSVERFRAQAVATAPNKKEMKLAGAEATAWDDWAVSPNVALFTGNIFSIEFVVQTYGAGAMHPNSFTCTLNFALQPYAQLEIQDLFKASSDYLGLLSRFCVSDLHKQQISRWHDPAERARELAVRQDEWILRGAGPSIGNYERFVLMNEGLRIFFDAYQVGSYAEGRYDVLVPREVFAPALKEAIAAVWP